MLQCVDLRGKVCSSSTCAAWPALLPMLSLVTFAEQGPDDTLHLHLWARPPHILLTSCRARHETQNEFTCCPAQLHGRQGFCLNSVHLRRLQIDLTVNHMLAIVNTKLLRDYAAIDERLAQLVFVVKHWAQRRQINDAYRGTLSSYCYALMCIAHLQHRQPPILPCLQELQPATHVRHAPAAAVAAAILHACRCAGEGDCSHRACTQDLSAFGPALVRNGQACVGFMPASADKPSRVCTAQYLSRCSLQHALAWLPQNVVADLPVAATTAGRNDTCAGPQDNWALVLRLSRCSGGPGRLWQGQHRDACRPGVVLLRVLGMAARLQQRRDLHPDAGPREQGGEGVDQARWQ